MTPQMEAQLMQLQTCMYQYSRAIYRSIKDLIDPYSEPDAQLESRRAVLDQCQQTMERLAADPAVTAPYRSANEQASPAPPHPWKAVTTAVSRK